MWDAGFARAIWSRLRLAGRIYGGRLDGGDDHDCEIAVIILESAV